MLQRLNEKIQGVIAWIIVIVITIVFVLFGADYYLQSHQENHDTIMKVNGEPISKKAYEKNYQRRQQDPETSRASATSEKLFKQKILEEMVANTITLQSAKSNGFNVSPEQARAAIINIPQFQQDGHFSTQRYQQALSVAMLTPLEFQNEVKQGMLLNQQRFAFIGSAFVLANEIKHFINLYHQTRDYKYLIIPSNLFLQPNTITNTAIENYYKLHKQELVDPEKVSIEYIQLSMDKLKKQIQLNAAEMQQYYQDNLNNFQIPARWLVSHILFALPDQASSEIIQQTEQKAISVYQILQKNPEKFAALANKFSDDKLSLKNHGLLPWMQTGQSEFDKILINLNQIGQIYHPVLTARGYEIFKLIDYKPIALKSFTTVQAVIKDQLLNEIAQKKFSQAIEKLNDLSYQTPDSLIPVAEALDLAIEHSEPFSKLGGTTTLTKNKEIINAAFNKDVLEQHNNSQPIQVEDFNVVVLRVHKHFSATSKSLIQVKPEITDTLAQKEAENLALQLGKLFVDRSDLEEQLLKKYNLHWKQVVSEKRDSEKVASTINELAFIIAKINTRQGKFLKNGDYVVIDLQKINKGNLNNLDKEQQSSIAQQIEANFGIIDYELYVNSLLTTAKVDKLGHNLPSNVKSAALN